MRVCGGGLLVSYNASWRRRRGAKGSKRSLKSAPGLEPSSQRRQQQTPCAAVGRHRSRTPRASRGHSCAPLSAPSQRSHAIRSDAPTTRRARRSRRQRMPSSSARPGDATVCVEPGDEIPAQLEASRGAAATGRRQRDDRRASWATATWALAQHKTSTSTRRRPGRCTAQPCRSWWHARRRGDELAVCSGDRLAALTHFARRGCSASASSPGTPT